MVGGAVEETVVSHPHNRERAAQAVAQDKVAACNLGSRRSTVLNCNIVEDRA